MGSSDGEGLSQLYMVKVIIGSSSFPKFGNAETMAHKTPP